MSLAVLRSLRREGHLTCSLASLYSKLDTIMAVTL